MKKRTAVERLADELYEVFTDAPGSIASEETWNAIARHVLARERRARGRTVGYVRVNTMTRNVTPYLARTKAETERRGWGNVARVVLVPRVRR